jgi:hypothetical protein
MMSGEPDIYTLARRILLDALEVLEPHRPAITLVGAQAVYHRVGEADVAVAPTTTDADLTLDPDKLHSQPALEQLMRQAGFERRRDAAHGALPGIWEKAVSPNTRVSVDLLIPEGVASPTGRRAARLRGHETGAVLKVAGLEAALVDADIMRIEAIQTSDVRSFEMRVAGPAALLVAKIHKILDRSTANDRLNDKDALDVFRLLRGTAVEDTVSRAATILSDRRSRATARNAFDALPTLFGNHDAEGVAMTIRATRGLMDASEVSQSLVALTGELHQALRG